MSHADGASSFQKVENAKLHDTLLLRYTYPTMLTCPRSKTLTTAGADAQLGKYFRIL